MKQKLLLMLMVLGFGFAIAQDRQVTGTVTEKDGGASLPGVNVRIKGTNQGTSTDADGKFSLNVNSSATALIFSAVGFAEQEVSIAGLSVVNVSMEAAAGDLGEVVVSVGRGQERTITDSPLPIDNITINDLKTTGQVSFDKSLQYRVPSFNSVNTPVNDATSLFDPYEIRNLGPSRTLILINGKRKNLTSLVYTQTSPGRGETGADLSAIPTDAIKRVEILRDGASAQYGSDAIAGVMNIILKDNYDGTSATFNTGSTLKYGGYSYGLNYNSGGKLAKNGYINYHVSFNHQDAAIREDKIDAASDARDLTNNTPTSLAKVEEFLDKYPDGLNKNGTPDNTVARFLVNSAIPVGENSEIYANAAYVFRKTISNANYRQPYWRADHGLLHKQDDSKPDYTVDAASYGSALLTEITADKAAGVYRGYIGYQPSFEGDLNDYNGTLGFRSRDIGGWKQDMSLTVGGNKMLFTVNNTVNRSLAKDSPISFKPGGFNFNHIVGNVDFSKSVTDKFYVGIGSEFRAESWQLIAGDTASYSGQGANSFPGFQDRNAVKATRSNIGAYLDLSYDITESFMLGTTVRTERYSDFGNAFVGKFLGRYKIGEVATIRASISNGFRAPTLHQQYLSLSQASFSGGDIVITGLANNFSREARLLGVPKLKAEKSTNFTAGLGLNPTKNLSLTLDYYYIGIKDRIIYSNEVSVTDVNGTGIDIDGISFFINAAETKTSGLDIVASYRNIAVGSGKLGFNLAGNYTMQNELVGGWEGVKTPKTISDAGQDLFNQTQESLMTTSRPKFKFIVGGDLAFSKVSLNLNNTIFGPTTFDNADLDDNLYVEFQTRMVTDVAATFNATSNLSITASLQNLFNIMPKYELKAHNSAGETILNDATQVKEQISYITFNGRYPVLTYDGSHFSQLGTTWQLSLNYKF